MENRVSKVVKDLSFLPVHPLSPFLKLTKFLTLDFRERGGVKKFGWAL